MLSTASVTFSDFYKTRLEMKSRGGTASKSYYYDSQGLESLPADVQVLLLRCRIPRSTAIELTRFNVLRDCAQRENEARAMAQRLISDQLSCRQVRRAVYLRLAELGLRKLRGMKIAA